MTPRKRILVTASARSGTAYVAAYFRLFTGRGRDFVGHEDVFGLHRHGPHGLEIVPGKLDWPMIPSWGTHQIEVSWLSMPYLGATDLAHDDSPPIIVHLVRDPIASIASIYRRGFLVPGNAYGEFANIHLGGDSSFFATYHDPLARACHYWCEWNMAILISKRAVAVWRVETLASSDIASVLNAAGVEYRPTLPPPKGINSGGDRLHDPERVPRFLADIPVRFQQRVSEVGRLFGYEVK